MVFFIVYSNTYLRYLIAVLIRNSAFVGLPFILSHGNGYKYLSAVRLLLFQTDSIAFRIVRSTLLTEAP